MVLELKRVDPLRTANILGLINGLMMIVFVLLFVPFLMVMVLATAANDSGMGGIGPLMMFFLMLFYPILGAITGWISGLLGAAIYNLIVRWTGGLRLTFEQTAEPGTP